MALYGLNTKLFLDDKPENDTSVSVAEGGPVNGDPYVFDVGLQPIPSDSPFATAYDWEFVPIGGTNILIRNIGSQRVLTSAPIIDPSVDPVVVESATLDTSLLPGGYIPQQIWKYDAATCVITQTLAANVRTLTWGGASDNRLIMTNQLDPAQPRVWVLPQSTFYNASFSNNLYYRRSLLPPDVMLLGTPPTLAQQLDGATICIVFLNEGGSVSPCSSSLANDPGGVQIATTDMKFNVLRYEGGLIGPVRDPTHTNTNRLFKVQAAGNNFNILSSDTSKAVVRNTINGTLSLQPNMPAVTNLPEAQFIFAPNGSSLNGRKNFTITDSSGLNLAWFESQQTIPGTPPVIMPEVDMKTGLSAVCTSVEVDIFSLSPFMSSALQLATVAQASQCCLKVQTTFVGTPAQFETMCTNLGIFGTTPACDSIMAQYCQQNPGVLGCSCISNATSTNTNTITSGVPIQCVNQQCAVNGYKTTAMVNQLGGPMATCGFPNCNNAMFDNNTPIYLPDGTQINCNQAPAFSGFRWTAGLIALIVFGGLMLLAIIIYFIWLYRRRRLADTALIATGSTKSSSTSSRSISSSPIINFPRGPTTVDVALPPPPPPPPPRGPTVIDIPLPPPPPPPPRTPLVIDIPQQTPRKLTVDVGSATMKSDDEGDDY